MSLHADVFKPSVILCILRNLENSPAAKDSFAKAWKSSVAKRFEAWRIHKDNKSTPESQLKWEAEVIEYVDYINSKLAIHGNAGPIAKDAVRTLDKHIPLLGPCFAPPRFLHCMRREATPAIKPETAYTKPLTVIHPVFYPAELANECPRCSSSAILWWGWNGTGARTVYGIRSNERAIGYQLRCKDCRENGATGGGYCFATTNQDFWAKWEHWKIPRSIPLFSKRAAVTHDLFDLIVELRPSTTSAGLSENIKQLHLLEYIQKMKEHLLYFQTRRRNMLHDAYSLSNFSAPTDETGYGDSFITNDLISDLYLDFVAKVRQSESTQFCQTRTAKSISLDNTFKSASKATVVDGNRNRQSPMKGGILSAINEHGERFCLSASPAETRELLQNVGSRHDAMGASRPLVVIVDNCCQVRRFICEGLGADTYVCLDVYHFMIRYGAVVYRGTKNTYRPQVLRDIRDAIIKTPAQKNKPATYWAQNEQEARLIEAYDRWLQHGGVWSAAAAKVHADQLEHVQKGCLSRPREDISMDGSCIEGSHKGWNSIQRAQPSGIEMYTALGHDFVHRRNIHISSSQIENKKPVNLPEFIASTYASHHLQFVDHIAKLFNISYEKEKPRSKAKLQLHPTHPQIAISESFGLVESTHSLTFGGLIDLKAEASLEAESAADQMLEDIDAEAEEMDQSRLIQLLGVDEQLISIPMDSPSRSEPRSTQKRKERSLPNPAVDNDAGIHVAEQADVLNSPNPKRRHREAAPSSPNSASFIPDSTPFDVLDLDSDEAVPNSSGAAAIHLNEDTSSSAPPATDVIIDCEPSDNAEPSNILLPNAPSDSAQAGGGIRAFFSFQPTSDSTSHSNDKAPASSPQPRQQTKEKPTLETLRCPLPLPSSLRAQGLTRSQLLFSVGTSIDPRALTINSNDEFYLFMDMRAEHQWASFSMTTSKWASATKLYNSRLEAIGKEKHTKVTLKSPRALMDKLNEIEPRISERILKNNYLSQKSNTEEFWKKHCAAVPALSARAEALNSASGNNNADQGSKKQKAAVCSRCQVLMYSGNKELHHRRGYCADGVAQKAKAGGTLPEWPQPCHIFSEGKYFNPSNFLFAVRDLYERVMDHTLKNTPTAAFESDSQLEDRAFSHMLESRTRVFEGHSFFLLYNDLEFTPSSTLFESLVSEFEGARYLHVDCL